MDSQDIPESLRLGSAIEPVALTLPLSGSARRGVAIVVVAGGIFAVLQLRHSIKESARESALQLLHSFQTPEFLGAVNIVFNLPEGLTKKEIEERPGDKMSRKVGTRQPPGENRDL